MAVQGFTYLRTTEAALKKTKQSNDIVWKETVGWPFSSESISFGNSCYLMPNKASLKVFFYAHSTFAPSCLTSTSTDTTFYCFLLQVRPKAVAASESPVMTTWWCGRTSHVLPGEWLGQRKTSYHPWKKSALHSVSDKFKGCITVNLLYLKLLSPANPSEINSQQNRECSLIATSGKQKAHWKLEKVLKVFASCSGENRHLSAVGRQGDRQQGEFLGYKVNSHLQSKKYTYTADSLGQLE